MSNPEGQAFVGENVNRFSSSFCLFHVELILLFKMKCLH